MAAEAAELLDTYITTHNGPGAHSHVGLLRQARGKFEGVARATSAYKAQIVPNKSMHTASRLHCNLQEIKGLGVTLPCKESQRWK